MLLHQVGGLLALAKGDVDDQEVYEQYYNLVETLRKGGTYDEWITMNATSSS